MTTHDVKGDLRERLRAAMVAAQQSWRTEDADSPELLWAMLDLEAVELNGEVASFLLRDLDGGWHGWRWQVYSDQRLPMRSWLFAHLKEDLNTSEPTEPDENGVRWWGVSS